MLPTSSRRCPSNASPVSHHSPTAVAPALRTSKSSPTSSPTTSSLLLLLPRDRTLGKAETRLGLQTRAALVYSLIRDTPGSSLTFSSGFEVLRIFVSHPFIPCLLCITTRCAYRLAASTNESHRRSNTSACSSQSAVNTRLLPHTVPREGPPVENNKRASTRCLRPLIMPSVESRATFHYNTCRPSFDEPSNASK